MRLLIIGATGMVGQAVLREALLADDVSQVRTPGRSPAGTALSRLRPVASGGASRG